MTEGFIYRLGVKLKETGERAALERRVWADTAICLGLAIRWTGSWRTVGTKDARP